MSNEINKNQNQLFSDIRQMVEEARTAVSQTVNAGLTMLYWNIGKRINEEILNNERAEYGERIIPDLAKDLTQEYGKSYSEKNLRRIMQFSKAFPGPQIVASLTRQLSWTHFTLLIPLKTDLERDFYAQMCRIEKWSVRTPGLRFPGAAETHDHRRAGL